MKIDIIIYLVLFGAIFFMAAISLLSLQDSDIKIPKKNLLFLLILLINLILISRLQAIKTYQIS